MGYGAIVPPESLDDAVAEHPELISPRTFRNTAPDAPGTEDRSTESTPVDGCEASAHAREQIHKQKRDAAECPFHKTADVMQDPHVERHGGSKSNGGTCRSSSRHC